MKIKDKLQEFTKGKRGLLATNFYNVETLHGVLKAAADLKEPLILQLTQSSIEYLGMGTAVGLARMGLDEFGVEGWIHLDHGGSVELVQRCLDAGFDSVMIDGSELSFEENVKISKEVVKRSQPYGAHVEAELGYVAKLDSLTENRVLPSLMKQNCLWKKPGSMPWRSPWDQLMVFMSRSQNYNWDLFLILQQ